MESREADHGYMVPAVRSGQSSKPPASPAQPDCLLTIGSQRLAAVLADDSDINLHVLVHGSPLFWVEDTGVLQTSDAEIAVRVSNIVRMEMGEDDLVSIMPEFRIGLTRLDQTAVKLAPRPAPTLRETLSKLRSLRPLNCVRVSAGGIIWLVMIATPLVFVAVAWQHHLHQANPVDLANEVVAAPDPPPPAPTIEQQTAIPTAAEPTPEILGHHLHQANSVDLANEVVAAPDPPPPTPTIEQQPTVPTVPEPTPEILHLPGVEPFLKPEVAKKLEITPSQASAFARLNKTTQDALEDLEKYWETAGRLELERRRGVLLDAARQEALQLLSDQQRQQWDALAR